MEEGRITFYEAVEEAEAIEERVWPDVDVIEFPADDPRSLPTEIISILSKGFVAPLFTDDIPLLLACLDAPPDIEGQTLERLWAHLEPKCIVVRAFVPLPDPYPLLAQFTLWRSSLSSW